jgi:hypothetical protein
VNFFENKSLSAENLLVLPLFVLPILASSRINGPNSDKTSIQLIGITELSITKPLKNMSLVEVGFNET